MGDSSVSDPDDEILEISLQALAAQLGKTPTVVDMHEQGEYHPETYVERFGSWESALEAAELDPDDMGSKYTDYELLDELHRLEEKLGRSPTRYDLDEHGQYSYKTYQNRFGSWNDAKTEAMLETDKISEDKLIRELRRLSREIDGIPNQKDMEEHGEHGYVTYYRRFGSWMEALEEAGLLEDDSL